MQKIKTHLVKACIHPLHTYPSYPLGTMPKTALQSLQTIQIKALRFSHNESYSNTKSTELHTLSNIEALIVTLHYRGNRIKHKMINTLHDEQYTTIVTDTEGRILWFRKPHLELNKNPPDSQCTKNCNETP